MKRLLILLLAFLLSGCAVTYDGPTRTETVLDSREEYHVSETGDIYYERWTEYTYDIYGRVAQTEETVNGRPAQRSVLRYNEDGSLRSETHYDLSGWFPIPEGRAEYGYDDQGRQISLVQWQGFRKSEQHTTYDDENHIVTIVADGSVTTQYGDPEGGSTRTVTEYNGGTMESIHERSGNTSTTAHYQDGKLTMISETIYDDQGRMLEWYETHDGQRELIQRYEYGEDYARCYYAPVERIRTTHYNEDGTVKVIVETDEHGTLTSQTIYRYTEIRVPATGKEEP